MSDRINISYVANEKLARVVNDFKEHIMSETLALTLEAAADKKTEGVMHDHLIDDNPFKVTIEKND